MTGAGYAARTKYDAPGRAARYDRRSARRHREEWALLERALREPLRGLVPRRVLDVPCGTGRLAAEWIARGSTVLGADLSPAMRERADGALRGRPGWLGAVAMDLEAPPESDAERFDLVVCFRFLHHLPDRDARARVLRSLAARSRGHVAVSFHHPASLHNLARAVRRLVTGRRGDRHTIGVGRLREEAEAQGLRWVAGAGLSPGLRELRVAVFATTAPSTAP